MPTYRLTEPDGSTELLEAHDARVEAGYTVLRGVALLIGLPREIVVRRVPRNVLVERVDQELPTEDRPSWALR